MSGTNSGYIEFGIWKSSDRRVVVQRTPSCNEGGVEQKSRASAHLKHKHTDESEEKETKREAAIVALYG